jgi:transposase-like protein
MTDAMAYSDAVRARMIRRMVGPGAMSARALARETGLSNVVLSKWLRQAGKVGAMPDDDPSERPGPVSGPPTRRQEWSAQEKLRAVNETSQLEGEALGEYLRRSGLHLAQVEQWREEATEALEPRRAGPAPSAGAERRRIKELERELRRKEKALAETAALLVLRKKLNALWGDGDDDTDEKNEP